MSIVVFKRLGGPTVCVSTADTIVTVPAGHAYLVRSITIADGGGAGTTAGVYVNGYDVANKIASRVIAAGGSSDIQCFVALNATDTLRVGTSDGNSVAATAFGIDQTL